MNRTLTIGWINWFVLFSYYSNNIYINYLKFLEIGNPKDLSVSYYFLFSLTGKIRMEMGSEARGVERRYEYSYPRKRASRNLGEFVFMLRQLESLRSLGKQFSLNSEKSLQEFRRVCLYALTTWEPPYTRKRVSIMLRRSRRTLYGEFEIESKLNQESKPYL